jgi:hypothetical protein
LDFKEQVQREASKWPELQWVSSVELFPRVFDVQHKSLRAKIRICR